MLPDIRPGNTKILYFFNCLLDGMHTKTLFGGVFLPAANSYLYIYLLSLQSPICIIFEQHIQHRRDRYRKYHPNSSKKISTKNLTKTIKKLKKKKTYYIKARAYKLDGKTKVYGRWSLIRKVTIKK